MFKIPSHWRNMNLWVHYALLTGVVFVAHHYSGFLEEMVVAGQKGGWVLLFVWYTLWIAFGDQLIHYVMRKMLPGWKD